MSARPGTGSVPCADGPAEPAPTAADLWPDRAGRPMGEFAHPVTPADQQSFDLGIPNIARVYDALLGGKDNYATDREAALALTRAIPSAARAARDNRAFLGRAVHYLAADAGISQFLDIGTGLPTQGNVHQIAQQASPAARVVYADNDPIVVAHARALLADNPAVIAVEGDVQYPRRLLITRQVRDHLDLDQPVAVLLVAVLHFVADLHNPWQAVRAIVDRMAPGSYLVISHVTSDQIPDDAVKRAREIYSTAFVPGAARSQGDIARFFDGTELIPPGVADVAAWRSGRTRTGPPGRPVLFWAGVGRKPASSGQGEQ